MGRVVSGIGLGLGLGSKVAFRAVFDIFRLKILEPQLGQTNFPDFHALSQIQNGGKGSSAHRSSELCVDHHIPYQVCRKS